MSKEQYIRANRLVFRILMVIMGYLDLTLIAAFLFGNHQINLIIQILAISAGIIGAFIG